MEKILYPIRRTTLKKIADAVRTVKSITGDIPVSELAKALKGEAISTTAPVATDEWYSIERQTLVDIADFIRSLGGKTDEIDVSDLEIRILNILTQLDKPIIVVYTEDITHAETPEVPSNPIVIQLHQPTITSYIEYITGGNEPIIPDEPIIIQLTKPSIEKYAEVLGESEQPEIPAEPIVVQLHQPKLTAYNEILAEPDEPEIPDAIITIQLHQPKISKYTEDIAKPEEPTIPNGPIVIHLYKPEITAYNEIIAIPDEPTIPNGPIVIQLHTPVINGYNEEIQTEEPSIPNEPIVIQLNKPVINAYNEFVFGESVVLGKVALGSCVLGGVVKPSIPNDPIVIQLHNPEINAYNEVVEDEEHEIPNDPITIQLQKPVITKYSEFGLGKSAVLGKVVIGSCVLGGAVRMTFANDGVINSKGEIVMQGGYGKAHSDIVALTDIANGPGGHCVQDFDVSYTNYPKVVFFSGTYISDFLGGYTVDQFGYKDSLTAEEIQAMAANFAGATHVAFNSDFEEEGTEDHVYIYASAQTYNPYIRKLPKPGIVSYNET